MSAQALKSPYPWAGGKSRVADLIWSRLGDVPVFVDPFFGSNAVLLCRPTPPRVETINDKDGFVGNVWRAIKHDPDAVAFYADDIVSEVDLHARHSWLVGQRPDLTERLMGDMDYYDAKIAGLWLWGICCWIGSGWCSGRGPWQAVDGRLVKVETARASTRELERKRPHLMHEGKGVHRKVAQMGDFGRGVHGAGSGLHRKIPNLNNSMGIHSSVVENQGMGVARQARRLSGNNGVNQQLPHLGDAGRGDAAPCESGLQDWMRALSERLRRVRVCCGDWDRILGPAGTVHVGLTGVILDPPYKHDERQDDLYAVDEDVWEACRDWAIAHGSDKRLRIVLCGYADQPETGMPPGWTWHTWKASGGYGSQGDGQGRANARRECLWFSPFCIAGAQRSLFDATEVAS